MTQRFTECKQHSDKGIQRHKNANMKSERCNKPNQPHGSVRNHSPNWFSVSAEFCGSRSVPTAGSGLL